MFNDNDSIEMKAGKLRMSETFGKVLRFSKTFPLDSRNKEDLRAALTTTALHVIDGLDTGAIQHDGRETAAMLYGLLVIALDVAHDGKLSEMCTEQGGEGAMKGFICDGETYVAGDAHPDGADSAMLLARHLGVEVARYDGETFILQAGLGPLDPAM